MQIIFNISDDLKDTLENKGVEVENLVNNAMAAVLQHAIKHGMDFSKGNSNEGELNVNNLTDEEFSLEEEKCKMMIKMLIQKYGDTFFEDAWSDVIDDFDNNKTELNLWEKISE